MNGTGLWHFNISWYVGLSRGWIISPQPVLLLFFLGGRFVTVQCQLHHHRAERIPSNFAPPFGHGMLVKPQQLNNYFSRPSSFIRRSCSPSGRWTLSAHTPAAVCAAKNKEAAARTEEVSGFSGGGGLSGVMWNSRSSLIPPADLQPGNLSS